MKPLTSIIAATILATSLSCTATKQENKLIIANPIQTQKSNIVHNVPQEELLKTLKKNANNEEFQIVYFPKTKTFEDITKKSAINEIEIDEERLEEIIETKEPFIIIHNHNNIDLDPKKDINPLYWLAPSPKDIGQYLAIQETGANFLYGVITQYGLLLMETGEETYKLANNPYFGKVINGEAQHIQLSLIDKKGNDLEAWAENYRGIFSLDFQSFEE